MSMADRDGFIWYDGKLVPWRDATTHVLTHSLHYGLAVFEGVRAYKTVSGTAIFRLKEHTDRLFNSAHIYRMPMPYDKETLMEAHKEVVRANKLESCYLRPIAFYGSEKMGVSPRGAATCMCRSPPGPGAPTSARKAWRRASASRPPVSRDTM
jgi:branched-chain amino acid aminotransferase